MFRLILAALVAFAASPAAAELQVPGSRFPVPGSWLPVEEGLSWLHSFEYERALAAFERAERANPRDAMAYWGQAMCYEQLLWGHENVEEARAILARMRGAGALASASARDRRFVATLDPLFGEGDRPARLAAYASAMGALAGAYPDDPDAAAFHGLALMATRARGLAGAHHAGEEMPQLVGSAEQEQAARIFTRILERHPRHPGALHYLIHAWDDPVNAHTALDAARAYASVVPESSHARHMPAHVFVQLGMWEEAIRSDAAAADAADAKVQQDGLPVTAGDFHPLSWLVYEQAQAGRFADARRALARLETPAAATQDPRLLSMLATLRSRVAIEEENWTALPGPGFVNYDELFAVGYSAAKRGDTGLAERARSRLSELAAQPRYAARRPLIEIMALQVGAAIRVTNGDVEGGLDLAAQAAAREGQLPPSIGPPPLVKPAQEQYAEMLLAAGRAQQAIEQFEAALARARNRRASVAGLARARERLSTSPVAAAARFRGEILAATAGATLLVIVLLTLRRRARSA